MLGIVLLCVYKVASGRSRQLSLCVVMLVSVFAIPLRTYSLNVEIKHKSACNFQRMDVKFDMVIVRDLLHVFHPNVAIRGEI